MTDKERIIAEIEKLKFCTMDEHMKFYCEEAEIEYNTLCRVVNLIKSMQEEPVSEDLMDATNNYCVNVRKGYPRVMDKTDRYICNAFKAGANWKAEQLMKDAIDVEVKVDAGGYPYIDKTIELYDYDKDIPLAKIGEKYKVVLIKKD